MGLALVLGVAGLWGAWSVYTYLDAEFPEVTKLKQQFPVVRYQGREVPPRIVLQRGRPSDWTSLGEISKVALGAIIVSEDWAFYQHRGFDPQQIKQAIQEDWQEGRFKRGASTITQQVVKNVFLTSEKSLWRKAKEFYLAIELEKTVGKRRILETYINIAEWGEGIFGVRAAARHYFGKSPSELTPKEGAFLAMLLPSPKRYSQSFRQRQLTEYASSTVSDILDKMVQARYLTEEERERERALPLSFEETLTPSGL